MLLQNLKQTLKILLFHGSRNVELSELENCFWYVNPSSLFPGFRFNLSGEFNFNARSTELADLVDKAVELLKNLENSLFLSQSLLFVNLEIIFSYAENY